MTKTDATDDGYDDPGPLQDVVRYAPGIVAVVLTVGVSLADHLPLSRPGFNRMLLAAAIPAVAIALLVSRSDWNPSGSRFFALTLLSWGVFSLARVPLLRPESTRIDGSVFMLADLGLVWLGSYALAASLVYGIDWPTPHVAPDDDIERADPEPADD